MKKILFALALMVSTMCFTGCGNTSKSEPVATDSIEVVDSIATDSIAADSVAVDSVCVCGADC